RTLCSKLFSCISITKIFTYFIRLWYYIENRRGCQAFLLVTIKQGVDKFIGFKGPEIHNAFADTDPLNRQAKFFFDSNNDTAFSRTVELGQHNTGDVGGFHKDFGLIDSVLPCRCIQHEKGFMRSFWYLA